MVQYLVSQLKAILHRFVQERSTSFIYSQIYEEWLPRQIQDVYTLCGSYTLVRGKNADTVFRILQIRLLDLIAKHQLDCSFEDLLASIHALMLYLIIHLFGRDTRLRRLGEVHLATLADWTCQLWQRAPNQIPASLSPW